MEAQTEKFSEMIRLNDSKEAKALAGHMDKHLRSIRELIDVNITLRGNLLTVDGPKENVRKASDVITTLRSMLKEKGNLQEQDVASALESTRLDREHPEGVKVQVFNPGKDVRPRSQGQAEYLDAIKNHDLTFAIGPAGTGKTYLAVAMAVSALKQQKVKKIILTRPAREAGESLGFLPGDLQAKVDPYLRPLYDALGDMMDRRQLRRYMEDDIVEVAPLAYMRGRTLSNSFIILDEAQNCTTVQMKMFLTRLGRDSKSVVTGDISQVDLPEHMSSGLIEALRILQNTKGIAFIRLGQKDIVRHKLVQDIVDAYEINTASKSRGDENIQDTRANGNDVR